MTSDMTAREALDVVRAGGDVGLAEATALLSASGDDLTAVAAVASAMRDEGLAEVGRERQITYSRKVFVPLTRLCRDRCHYCTFVTVPGKLARAG